MLFGGRRSWRRRNLRRNSAHPLSTRIPPFKDHAVPDRYAIRALFASKRRPARAERVRWVYFHLSLRPRFHAQGRRQDPSAGFLGRIPAAARRDARHHGPLGCRQVDAARHPGLPQDHRQVEAGHPPQRRPALQAHVRQGVRLRRLGRPAHSLDDLQGDAPVWPASWPTAQREQRISDVLEVMRPGYCSDRRIGGALQRGLSTGERKRLAAPAANVPASQMLMAKRFRSSAIALVSFVFPTFLDTQAAIVADVRTFRESRAFPIPQLSVYTRGKTRSTSLSLKNSASKFCEIDDSWDFGIGVAAERTLAAR